MKGPGQQIFQQPNDVMMQSMMKFFQSMMANGANGGTISQDQAPDLEQFYANKVNDMNQFYSQINDQSLNQSSKFVDMPKYDPDRYAEPTVNPTKKLNFDEDYSNEFVEVSNPYLDELRSQKQKPKQQTFENLMDFDDQPIIKPAKITKQKVSQDERPIKKQQNDEFLYDDRPIKSKVQQEDPPLNSYDERPIKSKFQKDQVDDERPIKSKFQKDQCQEDDRPIKSKYNNQHADLNDIYEEERPNKYKDDDRPIKGKQVQDEVQMRPAAVYNAFDERPIKSNPQNTFDERSIKNNPQYNAFDERPIKNSNNALDEKPIKASNNQFNAFDEKPIKSNNQYNAFDEKPIKANNQYNAFDEKPIKSSKPEPQYEQQSSDVENKQEKVAKPKTFLKKGTRQYLSNAQVRSDIAKKEQQEILKENNANNNQNTKSTKAMKLYTETNLYTKPEPKKQAAPREQFVPREQVAPREQVVREAQPLRKVEPPPVFDDQEDWNQEEEPKSKITEKYFAGPQPKKSQQQAQAPSLTQEQEEEIVRKYVQDKIDALNDKLQKVAAENDKVRKQKIKLDDQMKQLQREKEEWEKQKANEKLELAEFIEEEKKKIIREKRVQERQQKTFQNMPNRKEREELEAMKKQLEKAQEDQKAKDQKHKLNYDRMKKQCEDLSQRNQELQNEVKSLELRLVDQKSTVELKKPTSQPQIQNAKSVQNMKHNISQASHQEPQRQKQQQQTVTPKSKNIAQNVVYKNESESDEQNEFDDDREERDEDNHSNESDFNDDYEDIKEKSTKKQVQSAKQSIVVVNNTHNNKQKSAQKLITLIELQERGIDLSIEHINKMIPDSEFNFNTNQYYQQYKMSKEQPSKIVNQTVGADGKTQRIYANGKKEVVFHNGVKREVYPDGYTIVNFTNKDVKQTLPNGTIIYFFADAHTTQITMSNGPNIYRFANQQIEIHQPDGSKEIRFSDGTEKYISAKGEEETRFSDGIHQKVDKNRTKYIEYPNGNIDVIYPDGQKIRQTKN